MSHTKSGQRALAELQSKTWHFTKKMDRVKLQELADDLLAGHRSDDIMLNEDTYDPHIRARREVSIDPKWEVFGDGTVEGSFLVLSDEWQTNQSEA